MGARERPPYLRSGWEGGDAQERAGGDVIVSTLRSAASRIVALLVVATQLFFAAPSPSSSAAVAPNGTWTVYHHDDGHTGYDPSLPRLSSVSTGWVSGTMDAQVYASPLIDNGMVYAATLNNTVYAFNQATGATVWSVNLGAPETTGWSCGNVSPQGILGTPVIDAAGGRTYVTTLFGSDDIYRVFGLNLATGVTELQTAIPINLGSGFDWTIEQQRGALALHNGYVYVPFGGRAGDCGNYHGWVFAVPINGGPVTSFYQTPGAGAGFWTAGGLVVDDNTGQVFAASGNGVANGCAADVNGNPVFDNDAVVRLSATLAHEDSFIPKTGRRTGAATTRTSVPQVQR